MIGAFGFKLEAFESNELGTSSNEHKLLRIKTTDMIIFGNSFIDIFGRETLSTSVKGHGG